MVPAPNAPDSRARRARTTTRSPFATPAAMITRVASKGAVRTGRGSNSSASSCRHTIASPLALRTTASFGTIMAVTGSPLAAMTLTGSPMAEIGRRILHHELHDRRVLLQRMAEALEAQLEWPPARRRRCGIAERRRIELAIDQRFDPQARRIDDLEQDVLRLHHLARHDARRCDDAGGRRPQRFRLDADLEQDLPAPAQTFDLGFGVDRAGSAQRLAFRPGYGCGAALLPRPRSVARPRQASPGSWCDRPAAASARCCASRSPFVTACPMRGSPASGARRGRR